MSKENWLGCVLAGGKSSRFGSDKALAVLNGRSLLERAVEQLAGWCGAVVVAGRAEAPAPVVADWPAAGMGPLGGLAGALRHARERSFAAVLATAVDSVGLPHDTPAILVPGPACFASQPVIGLWPTTVLPALETLLQGNEVHSFRNLARVTGARMVDPPALPANVNTPADLARLAKQGD